MARKFLNIGRGVRQDYSLPPYLFILSVEVLAKAIRRNKKKIKGILVNQEEIELSQYVRMTRLKYLMAHVSHSLRCSSVKYRALI